MKPTLYIFTILISILSIKAVQSQSRIVEVPGNISHWALVGSAQANTPFQIQGKGTVDFGCKLEACKDGVNAGVTGNAFAKAFRDNWGTIENLLKDMAKDMGMGVVPFNEKIVMKPGEDVSSFIDRKKSNGQMNADVFFDGYTKKVGQEVNYDEGGFWIIMTTNNQPPVYGQNTFCEPALYYWYNELYKELIKEGFAPTMRFTKTVWVWALPHDGGKNPFSIKPQDFHDNSGAYSVWLQ